MFIALDKDGNFAIFSGNAATFKRLTGQAVFLDFTISGRTYTEKKDSLKNIAIDYFNLLSDFSGCGFSYGELSAISEYFYNNGKRYGLLEEFRKNAIF